jgi:hypothetical protein
MNEQAQMIKTAIMLELAKEGKTLQDLENELATKGIDKVGNSLVDKLFGFDMMKSLGNTIFNLSGGTAVALGALGGTGLYSAYRGSEDSSEQQLKKIKEKIQYEEATKMLQDRMAHPDVL